MKKFINHRLTQLIASILAAVIMLVTILGEGRYYAWFRAHLWVVILEVIYIAFVIFYYDMYRGVRR